VTHGVGQNSLPLRYVIKTRRFVSADKIVTVYLTVNSVSQIRPTLRSYATVNAL
jgi:hypothetical protein